MSAFGNYLEAKIINWAFRAAAMGTAPANVYIGLHTADPGEDGTTAEVSTFGYARKAVSTTGGWSDPGASSGATDNIAEIAFAAASGGSWGTITHFSVWDALTTGNLLFKGALTASKVVSDGDILRFAAGQLDISVA